MRERWGSVGRGTELWKEVKLVPVRYCGDIVIVALICSLLLLLGKRMGLTPKSFRSISLTSFLLKTMEKVIDNYIRLEIMEEASPHQSKYAYSAGRSIGTALLELTGTIQKTLDEGETAVCAFLDVLCEGRILHLLSKGKHH
ncbi:hypothetical protein Trydic_g5899 [Trypoxylus dichotomus]